MRSFLIILTILILLFLSYAGYLYYINTSQGTSQNSIDNENPQEKSEEVTVGWIGPLTGPANAFGIDSLDAVKLALAEYLKNKHPEDPVINLISRDDQYNADLSVKEYNELVNKHKAKAIIINTYSGLKAIAPKALEDSVILIDAIDNDQKLSVINHNIFLIAKETEVLAATISNEIIDKGKKNVTVMYYEDDDFMPTLADTTREILLTNNISIHLYSYKKNTTDFNLFLEKAKANKSDAYVFYGYKEIEQAVQQAKKLDIKAPFYFVNVLIDPALYNNPEGSYLANFTVIDGNKVNAREFLKNFKLKFHKEPLLAWTAMQGYDAATILFSAIRAAAAKKTNFADNLRNELLSVTNFDGVSGNISILPNGASRGIYPSLYIFQDGKFVSVAEKQ